MTDNIFNQKAYDEALNLAEIARFMILNEQKNKRGYRKDKSMLDFEAEKLRVTLRITRIVSWLMFQKAVEKGEISQKEALEKSSDLFNDNNEELVNPKIVKNPSIPNGLKKLVKESSALYSRIIRTDKLLRKEALN